MLPTLLGLIIYLVVYMFKWSLVVPVCISMFGKGSILFSPGVDGLGG